MIITDFHCDTISAVKDRKKELYSNDLHIDLKRMISQKRGTEDGFIQVFALYCGKPQSKVPLMRNLFRYLDCYYENIEKNKEHIRHCNTYDDITSSISTDRVASILAVEGGDVLLGEMSALRTFYRLGVRLLTLTHWYNNEISGSSASLPSQRSGLTQFGRDIVKEMNVLGMLIDVAHLSDNGFYDVISSSSTPIVASHSNARKLCGHSRNLTDDQILTLSKKGGVIGINFLPDFLNYSGKAKVSDIVRHIEYIAGLGGIDCVGFGSDFDGIDSLPEGIRGIQDFTIILNELAKLNYRQDELDKIAGLNLLDLLKKVLVSGT